MASTTMTSTIANKATSLEASLSLPQMRISLSTLFKHRAAVSYSANTSVPLELYTVLAQSHPHLATLKTPPSFKSRMPNDSIKHTLSDNWNGNIICA